MIFQFIADGFLWRAEWQNTLFVHFSSHWPMAAAILCFLSFYTALPDMIFKFSKTDFYNFKNQFNSIKFMNSIFQYFFCFSLNFLKIKNQIWQCCIAD